MNQKPFMKFLPYIVAIIIFLGITLLFFYPMTEGRYVRQGDNLNYKGMSKEIVDYRESTGKEALWTNSMFGGMPSYQISFSVKENFIPYIDKIFTLDMRSPAGLFFLYFIGFFILLLVLDVDPWLSIAGAIAYALSSYFVIIIEAGHNSKVHAIGYVAPVLAGIILSMRGKYLLGGLLTALFLSLEFNAGHPQIAYYMFIIILFLIAGEFISIVSGHKTQVSGQITSFIKSIAVIAVAGVIAILPNITSIWATYEYGKYTIRGKTELTTEKQNRTTGLDKDYATDWSYGIGESFSLMVPNIKGGGSESIGNNESALKDVDPQYKETIANNGNQYWGDQPFTSGPVYAGAIIMFLFVLGMFILKGRLKWTLFAVTILSVLLSWGKNFWSLTNFFLDYVPLYNKFRTVSMTLIIAELTIPLIAMLALNEIIKNQNNNSKLKTQDPKFRMQFFIALGLTGGLCLLFYLLPKSFFDFLSIEEVRGIAQQKAKLSNSAEQIDAIYENLVIARLSIFKADVLRSLIFIILGAGAVWLFSIKKLTKPVFIIAIILLIIIDLYPVDRRYLNDKNFVASSELRVPFPMSKADELILKDKDPDYRVLNMAANTFNDASTSYYHMSIGGYHGAKLRRYQEIIENSLTREMSILKNVISNKPTELSVSTALQNLPVLNMLNTRYFILNPEGEPLRNKYALGNAWFVNDLKFVNSSDEEIKAVNEFNPSETALIDVRYKGILDESHFQNATHTKDTVSKIKLDEYKPDYLAYSSASSKEQLAVFSEIYYDKGWNAFIDGKTTKYLRADYILRAMVIPAGNHKIEFKFEPKVYYTGRNISFAGSLILIISLIVVGYFEIKAQLSRIKLQDKNLKGNIK